MSKTRPLPLRRSGDLPPARRTRVTILDMTEQDLVRLPDSTDQEMPDMELDSSSEAEMALQRWKNCVEVLWGHSVPPEKRTTDGGYYSTGSSSKNMEMQPRGLFGGKETEYWLRNRGAGITCKWAISSTMSVRTGSGQGFMATHLFPKWDRGVGVQAKAKWYQAHCQTGIQAQEQIEMSYLKIHLTSYSKIFQRGSRPKIQTKTIKLLENK